jgi:membrane protease YdiL (CAAX protease family)
VPQYALLAAVGLLGLAITAWVFAPALRGPEAARRDLGSHRLTFGSVVAVLLLNTLLTLPLANLLRDNPLSLETFALAALSTQIPILVVVYARLIWPRAVTWQELGLRPIAIDRALRVGLATGLLGLLLTILLSAVMAQFGLLSNQFEQFGFVRGAGPIGLAVVLFFAAVSAPFTEELFFRGVLFGLYRRRQPTWLAYLVSGVLFAAAHVMPTRMSPSQMAALGIGIFALGTLLAWTYQRTGSLYPGMLAHAVNNATGLILLYSVEPR